MRNPAGMSFHLAGSSAWMKISWLASTIAVRSAAGAAAEEAGGVDLDEKLGRGQRAHLHERGGRKVAGEELAPRTPDLFALLDVRHVDVETNDVVHRPAGGVDEVLDLGEGLPGLAVHRAVSEHAAGAVTRGHAGDEDLVAVDPTIRPRPGRGLLHLRTGHARHLHGAPPSGIAPGLYPNSPAGIRSAAYLPPPSSSEDELGGPMKRFVIAVLILAALVQDASAQPRPASPTKREGEMRWALYVTLAPAWFDPGEVTAGFLTPFWVLYALHDALVKPMPGNLMTPSLAESWTVSADQRVYEFKLREGLKFHNGD